MTKFLVYSHTLLHPVREMNLDRTVHIILVKMDHLRKR